MSEPPHLCKGCKFQDEAPEDSPCHECERYYDDLYTVA